MVMSTATTMLEEISKMEHLLERVEPGSIEAAQIGKIIAFGKVVMQLEQTQNTEDAAATEEVIRSLYKHYDGAVALLAETQAKPLRSKTLDRLRHEALQS
jgi:hypothetical protein